MTIVEATRIVTGGIDTHGEVHVGAVLDEIGGLLGTESFPADPDGYAELLTWLKSFGYVAKVGVEGTDLWSGHRPLLQPSRGPRRRGGPPEPPGRQRQAGKSDPLDTLEAAQAAQSGRAHGAAKSRDGSVEAIRVLVVAKRSARGATIKALGQMRQLTFSAPDQLQSRLKGLHPPPSSPPLRVGVRRARPMR